MAEGLAEVSKPIQFIDQEVPESEVRIEEVDYHGVRIRLVGIEHEDHIAEGFPEFSTRVPSKWEEIIEKNIQDATIVFLEYFPPDLFANPIRRPLMEIWTRKANIKRFFSKIGKMAKEKGILVAVADPARSIKYALEEVGKDEKAWKEIIRNLPPEQRVQYGGQETAVSPLEISHPTAIDARRLVTARALTQEALRQEGSGTQKKDIDPPVIVYIAPPTHTLRIRNYIERQKQSEGEASSTGAEISEVSDFARIGRKEELGKMEVYKRRGLVPPVRYYRHTGRAWRKMKEEHVF